MKTTIHCDERITNIRNSIYVKLFWGIIILDTLAYLLDYFFQTSLNGWVIPLAPCVLIIWMSIKGVLFNGTQHFPHWCWLFALCYSSLNSIIHEKNGEENKITIPEGVDPELLMKVLGNPGMAALLTSLAKTMKV